MVIKQFDLLIEGDMVYLDADLANSSQVKLIGKGKIFSTVESGNDKWRVMTYRLSPKIKLSM